MPAGKREVTPERVLGALARAAGPSVGRLLALPPIRRLVYRRALRAWRATDEPLILCFGNINRSPFAAALAQRRADSSAGSAGFYPEAGRPSPPLTLAGAQARGVDLAAHRSVVVSDAQLAGAAAIFIFDLENLSRVAVRRASALPRTHFLGALAPDGPVFIVDPHGHGQAMLEDVLNQIQRAVEHADLAQGEAAQGR